MVGLAKWLLEGLDVTPAVKPSMFVKCSGFAPLGVALYASPMCADVVVVVIPASVPTN